ncbi:hypothetical protein LJ707_17530 [Mucilaginibacter sp. UR6-1]|uniref:hypothetical protein n=1 Tax=Mucilaginibacter sp. UR6-1 TaxID=1435643 RepID=UPI001E34A873|nr:hypothetical protein [Mucilaginibacter sp. UR6-1]MCC8410748.1 hypothetical protein [Mucilaginibacter sp. UR6-1]
MRSKIYKLMFSLLAFTLLAACAASAQKKPAAPTTKPAKPVTSITINGTTVMDDDIKVNLKNLDVQLKDLNVKLNNKELKKLNQELAVSMKNMNKDLNLSLANLNKQLTVIGDIDIDIDNDIDNDIDVNTNKININGKSYNNIQDDDLEEKVKNYSKSYPADRNDALSIDNRYGKVTVITWNKNEFKVDVQIKVATNKEGKVQKMLDDVTIADGRDGQTVWFKTKLGDSNDGGSWSIINGSRRSIRRIEINYTVYMPAKNSLAVTNRYGSTVLPDLAGKVTINHSYGNFAAKNLTNIGNDINVKYGSATIEGLTGSELNVAYGNLNLSECEKLNANVSYGSAKIGSIKTSGNINVKYSGGLNIATLDKNLKNLVVNSSYSGVKLGVSEPLNIDFDVTVHYGSFNYDNDVVNVVNKNPSDEERGFNPTKNFKGKLGKGSNGTIVIKSNYGSVKFE